MRSYDVTVTVTLENVEAENENHANDKVIDIFSNQNFTNYQIDRIEEVRV